MTAINQSSMNKQLQEILEPYFKEFAAYEDELDKFALVQYVLETGTKIFQLYKDYGLESFDKAEIADVWNALYLKYIIKK